MTPTLRLGRVFGIQISMNWSLLFVFALIAWSVASAVPSDVPNRPVAEYWLAGILAAAGFYVCLLAHELAHSLLARRLGTPVSGITLWLFGGVSNLEGEPRSAAAEGAITAVGPMTSLALALILSAAGAILGAGRQSLTADVLAWLGYINLALGLFNLLPAFPLDGGRLLSAILWWRGGNRRQAVHRAARVGRWVAFAMIGVGFLMLWFGQLLNGVWTAFLGWFLLSAASAEERGLDAQELLKGIPVSAAMSSPVITLPDWLTVGQLLESAALGHRFTTYPVHDRDNSLTGVVRLPEVLHSHGSDRDKRLHEVAHPIAEVPTARPEEDLSEVVRRAGPRIQLRVLVYDGDRLAGILSPTDVVRVLTVRGAGAAAR
ncbi:MAG TPA: site-2 protease family protein [Candidatus Dormibacteraeota bacterium]